MILGYAAPTLQPGKPVTVSIIVERLMLCTFHFANLAQQHQVPFSQAAIPSQQHPTSVTNYHCHICGKRFNFPSLLARHMRIHTGERPFPCPYCSHRANQKSNLQMHIRTNHGFVANPGPSAP